MKFRFELKAKTIFWYFIIIFLINIFNIITRNYDLNLLVIKGKYIVVIMIFFAYFILELIEVICCFFILKAFIDSTFIDDIKLSFEGKFNNFIKIVLFSFFLNLITILIYYPFYITRLTKFFFSNTKYKDKKIEFLNDGLPLFVIMLFLNLIPILVIKHFIGNLWQDLNIKNIIIIATLSITFILVNVIYIFYLLKWFINLRYYEYDVTFNAKSISTILFIFFQILLSILTLFIYLPVAIVKIYQYMILKIKIDNYSENIPKLTSSFDKKESYNLIGKQLFLSIVTLGIYLPWAFCNIVKYMLERTSLEFKKL